MSDTPKIEIEEIKDVEQKLAERRVIRAEKEKIGIEMGATIMKFGDKIKAEAAKQHRQKIENVDWSVWSVGRLELKNPISIADLSHDFPKLAQVLKEPSGEIEEGHDLIDDKTLISAVRYWRNPDSHYLSTTLFLKDSSTDSYAQREISLVSGPFLGREWWRHPWVRESTEYSSDRPIEHYRSLGEAVQETARLVDKIISGAKYKATYTSHTIKME